MLVRFGAVYVVAVALLLGAPLFLHAAELESQNFRIEGYSIGEPRESTATSSTFDAGFAPGPVYRFDVATGCTDPTAENYDPAANTDDGSCVFPESTDDDDAGGGSSGNRPSPGNPSSNPDPASTSTPSVGCTDVAATNYDPAATQDDGSCQYEADGSGGDDDAVTDDDNADSGDSSEEESEGSDEDDEEEPESTVKGESCSEFLLPTNSGESREARLVLANSTSTEDCPVRVDPAPTDPADPPVALPGVAQPISEISFCRPTGVSEAQKRSLVARINQGLAETVVDPFSILFRDEQGAVIPRGEEAASVILALPEEQTNPEAIRTVFHQSVNSATWRPMDCTETDEDVTVTTDESGYVAVLSVPAGVGFADPDTTSPDATSTSRIAIGSLGYWLSPVGLGSGILIALLNLLQIPFSLSNIARVLGRSFYSLFGLPVFWKKHKPWGTVYDSRTKEPLDPAYVQLQTLAGEDVAESITDLDGRYGFLVEPGTYQMVVQRTNYRFPSQQDERIGYDVVYHNPYYGGPFSVGATVARDIPLDRVDFDWNQYEKLRTNQVLYYHWFDPAVSLFLEVVFYVGLAVMVWQAIAHPSVLAFIFLLVYMLLLWLRLTRGKPPLYGYLLRQRRPLANAVVRVYRDGREILTKVADQQGRYVALVSPGTYNVQIDELVGEETYETVYEGVVKAPEGVINQTFKI